MEGFARRQFLNLVAIGGVTAGVSVATSVPAVASDRHSDHHPDRDDNRYQQVDLVSDVVSAAKLHDANLVNAWGLAFGPTTPLWVSNNGSDTSTLYRGTDTAADPVTAVPLVVKIPGSGAPTGVVFNGGDGFMLSTDGKTGKAVFIFAGEGGKIFGWNNSGDPTSATQVASTRNAVYKGLATVTVRGHQYLLAANFHANRIDVFDSSFTRLHVDFAFRSVGIPWGYAPFNVAVLGGRVFVSYAKQDADKHDDVAGAGHGFVNEFSVTGYFRKRIATRNVLNSPWGLAIAPAGFGKFSGDLLVGNFGDGRIHAYSPSSGHLKGTLRGAHGVPLVIHGLWGLLPGNGVAGKTTDVWFSAGPSRESHGLLGVLHATDDD